MDASSLGLAWGRISHRRTRSSDPSNNAAPIEFTSDGTRYTPALEAPSPAPSPKPPTAQHSRSKSWSTFKEKNQAGKSPIFFQFADFPNYRASLSPPNPLHLHRVGSSKRSHKISNSISSVSTKHASFRGSVGSIELLQKPLPTIPPQRPPRPPRGLFEDESDEEPTLVGDDLEMDHAAEENIHGLILQSDQAFADVDMALADAAYNTHVAQLGRAVSRNSSVRHHGQGITPAATVRRSSVHSTRSLRRSSIQSSHSTSTSGHAARPPTTKKMGKHNVLLPRKLRFTLSQSVSELLTSRASKRVSIASSLSSAYSDDHKRNSSITAAKRQSGQQAKRQSTDSQFALGAKDGKNLTASQMYHREMLPNSVMAWMGTDADLTELDDADDDDEDFSHEFENKCNLASEPNLTQPPTPMLSADNFADVRPLPVEGSPPPPPPPKNPARFGARARTSELAPIPEMLVASADGERRRRKGSLIRISPKSKRPGTRTKAVPSDSLYLVGTAYSKASPLFRHGHIEFQHKGLKVKAEDDEQEGADEQVDWPAFHSSILCDAEDLDSGMALDEANAMADELGEWFEEFGFESHGALIQAGRSREHTRSSRSMASTRSSASSSSTISDADLPMPASPERSPFARMQRWSFAQAERNAAAAGRDEHASDPIPVATEMELGLNTYGLPPEAQPLSKPGSSRGPRMGCNLSDDLGQFLAWNPTLFDDMHE